MIDGGVPNTAEKTVFPTLPTAVLLHIAVIAATPALIVAVVERVAAAVGAGVGAGVIGDGVGGQSVQPLHAKNASHFQTMTKCDTIYRHHHTNPHNPH